MLCKGTQTLEFFQICVQLIRLLFLLGKLQIVLIDVQPIDMTQPIGMTVVHWLALWFRNS